MMSLRFQAGVYFVHRVSRANRRKENMVKSGTDTHHFNPEEVAFEIAWGGVFMCFPE